MATAKARMQILAATSSDPAVRNGCTRNTPIAIRPP
jgi:hypothetical protein